MRDARGGGVYDGLATGSSGAVAAGRGRPDYGDRSRAQPEEDPIMRCPNCILAFRLRADYAAHLQDCRPARTSPKPSKVAA